jgi:putative acetyltransferase
VPQNAGSRASNHEIWWNLAHGLGDDSSVAVSLTVRSTVVDDHSAVLEVVRSAFSDDVRDGTEEVDIVVDTWALGQEMRPIDLVAGDRDAIVGHVLGARGTFGVSEAIAVAPLSVAPNRQGRGVGTRLMHEFLDRADEENWPLAVLLGSPAYYSRFGFEPASQFGITYEPVGQGNPHFQARRLRAFTESPPGTFNCCWEPPP